MTSCIGCAIVSVQRIIYLMENKEALKGMLHPSELQVMKGDHLAGIIAAKEAFFKALGESPPRWLDVEATREKNGRPRFTLSPDLSQRISKCDMSISHDGDYTVAFVMLELQ
ncbi:4'-phosphopantetheinyl transferase superfamily protein [Candidatus Woesearchaeota archaeon]|nr:4'-phosphopantetheinyl transferase superfamily protein [Candidatus Woesearchaeota archaeon]